MMDRATKWRLYVARRRARKINWSAAKVTLVAIKSVGVGPGVKMLDHRSPMKEAMIFKMKLEIRRLQGEGVRELESVGGKWLPESTPLRLGSAPR